MRTAAWATVMRCTPRAVSPGLVIMTMVAVKCLASWSRSTPVKYAAMCGYEAARRQNWATTSSQEVLPEWL